MISTNFSGSKIAQTAVEFIIIFGFVLFFFVMFFGIVQDTLNDKSLEKETLLANNLALDVQNEISTATSSTEGYYREFTMPANILGLDYEANITDASMVYIHIGTRVGVAFEVAEVSGDLRKGVNVIRKEGGVVYLN